MDHSPLGRTLVKILLALFVLVSPVAAADVDQTVTYWIGESSTSGYVIENIDIDFPKQINGEGRRYGTIGNIAMTEIRLTDGRITKPAQFKSFIVECDGPTASAKIRESLTSLGSLQHTLSSLVGSYAHLRRTEYDLANTLYLMRTVNDSSGVNATTVVQTWSP